MGATTLVIDSKDNEVAIWAVQSRLFIEPKESRLVGAWLTDRAGLTQLHVWPPTGPVVASRRAAEALALKPFECMQKLGDLEDSIEAHQKFFEDRMSGLPKSKQRENPSWPLTENLHRFPEPQEKTTPKDGALALARWLAQFVDAITLFEQQKNSRDLFTELDQRLF